MEPHLTITSVILGSFAAVFALVSTYLLWQETAEINRKLPDGQRISYYWMYAEKFSRIRTEYKRLYPNGRIHFWGTVFEIAAVIFFFSAVIAAGFFR